MTDLPSGVVLLIAGGLAGFLTGLFGVGGGIILVPFLLVFLKGSGASSLVATHLAIGTSLCVAVFVTFPSVFRSMRSDPVSGRAIALVGGGSIVMALGGGLLAAGFEPKTLQQIFGVIVFVTAFQFFSDVTASKREPELQPAQPALVGSGLVVGLISSLTGVEGIVFGVPLMYRFLDFPLKQAIGYAGIAAFTAASASSIMYGIKGWDNPLLPSHTLGYVDYLSAIPLIIGALLAGKPGVAVANKVRFKKGRKYYGLVLVVIAAGMFLW